MRSRRARAALAAGGAALSAVAGAALLVPSLSEGRDELPVVAASPVPTAQASGEVARAGPVDPVPPQDPAGAELCKDSFGPADHGQCYDLGPEQAQRLAAALSTGRPSQPGAVECLALPVAIYRARFMPVAGVVDRVVWVVPSGLCLPMTAGAARYDLPDDAQAGVAGIWDVAGLLPLDEVTTGRRAPSPPRG